MLRGLKQHLRRRWKDHLLTLLILLGVYLGVNAWQTRHVPQGPAPELSFVLLQPDGSQTTTSLTQWRANHPGQAVALHLWAEWCPICRAEEHNISSLVVDRPVLTIAMRSGPPEAVARVLAQRQLRWPVAVDSRGDLTRQLGFSAVPAFVVIDPQGRLRSPSVGYTSELGMRLRLWWADTF